MNSHPLGFYACESGKVYNRKGQEVGSLHNKMKRYLISYYKDGKQKKYYRSVLVWEAFKGEKPKGYDVDHINGDPADDRLENLRLLSHSDNIKAKNNRSSKGTGYRGVVFDRKWIRVSWVDNGKQVHKMQKFKSVEDAALYRDEMAFRCGYPLEGLNFPERFKDRERKHQDQHSDVQGHPYYNSENFPLFIAHQGNWKIQARADDWHCAAIAVNSQCASCSFGDAKHTAYILKTYGIDFDRRKAVAIRRQKQIDERMNRNQTKTGE